MRNEAQSAASHESAHRGDAPSGGSAETSTQPSADGPTPDDVLTGWRLVAAWPLLAVVRFYRRWISPALPATCRFYPTCSTYGLTALLRFGPIKGTWLTLRRLARCHPWNPGGVDHVPAK